VPAARFFRRFDEQDGAPVDPLENPRPDWLGVRTVAGNQERLKPTLRDSKMERASAEEPAPPPLPVVMRITDSPDELEETALPAPEPAAVLATVAPVPATEPSPSGRSGIIELEYSDQPALAGRPRMRADGAVLPPRRTERGPERYGPEPTYPAAYYAEGSAPASVPRSREVWPAPHSGRPNLIARLWQRLHRASGTGAPTSAATGSGVVRASDGPEPGDVAKAGE
jgi:hypothetical protein